LISPVSILRNWRPIVRKAWRLLQAMQDESTAHERQKLRRELVLLTMSTAPRYPSLEAMDIASSDAEMFCVMHGGLRFDCLLKRGGSLDSPLFVVLSGLRSPEKHPIPKFDRISRAPVFSGHVLYVSDPVHHLAPDARTGWYLGDSSRPGIPLLADVVRAVAGGLGVADDQVIAYGSSAGGFAAVKLAAHLGTATAVAINAQTKLWLFRRGTVNRWRQACFPDLAQDVFFKRGSSPFDLHETALSHARFKLLYVQNRLDEFHFRTFYQPFCAAFRMDAERVGLARYGRMSTYLFEHASGHGAETLEIMPDLVSEARELAALRVDEESAR
jgi:hypothetical protein